MTELLRQIGSCVNILHRIMPLKGEAICEYTITLFVFVFGLPPVYEGTKELFRTPVSVNPLRHEVLSMDHVPA